MDVLIFVFAVGIVIIGGLYAWTFTKPGKKMAGKLVRKTRKRDMDARGSPPIKPACLYTKICYIITRS